MTQTDLIVIGAGPAGMAAAAVAAGQGLRVTLLDEQPRAGGQIYRDVTRVAAPRGAMLGDDYRHGLTLTKGLDHPNVTHVAGASVWSIEAGFRVAFTHLGRGRQVSGDRLILATGALERPMPLPGWTLPGVMTVGAAQILLKQSGVLARRAVLVGCGPLLYLTAAQMVRAGQRPMALIETQTSADLRRALRHLGGALTGWRDLAKGLKLLAELRRAKVPRFAGAQDIRIEGGQGAAGVTFRAGGKTHVIACDTVLLHHGVVPNTQGARALEVPHHWSAAQHCFVPRLDPWGETPVPGVFIAGDGAGIGGALVAETLGRIAALRVAHSLGRLSDPDLERQAAPLQSLRKRQAALRPFLDAAYPPFAGALAPQDDTLICRCEEVTAGDIRRFARLGCPGPNQAKAFGRAGMGPCQGRFCGLSVTTILAQAHGATPDQTGYFRIRPPLKPVTLGELADLHDGSESP